MRFDSNFRNARHLESIDLHDERMDIVSLLFLRPRYMERGEAGVRVQSDWQRNTYTYHTNSMSRATCSLVLHRFGEEHRFARAVIKKKDARNQVFPRERNASPRHAYTRRATSNERFSSGGHRTPLLDIPIPFSFISSYFTSAIIPRLIRTVANACSTRIECESTRSDLFRLRIVRHPTTTLKSSNQRVDHVRASIEQREDRTRGIRPFIEYVYCIPYILENIFHDIV